MRTWDFGINSHPDHRTGDVCLYERPWWLSLIWWAAFALAWDWLRNVELPHWPVVCWDKGDPENTTCSPWDWWGDLNQVVLIYWTNPLIQWVGSHPRNRQIHIDLGYDRVREIFGGSDRWAFEEEAGAPVTTEEG